jgi:hypothetical protein
VTRAWSKGRRTGTGSEESVFPLADSNRRQRCDERAAARSICVRTTLSFAVFTVLLCGTTTASAYRSAADLPEFADDARIRWESSTIEVVLSERVPSGLLFADVERALFDAMVAWDSQAGTDLDFVYAGRTNAGPESGDGRVTVHFVDAGWSELGFADVGATTEVLRFVQGDGASLRDADLFINSESLEWSVAGDEPAVGMVDLRSAFVHELGHVIGLLHSCELRGAGGAPDCAMGAGAGTVMHPTIAQGVVQRTLSQDDIDGLSFLYPEAGCEATGCAAPLECVDRVCELVCEGAVCGDGERCGPMGCEPVACEECGEGAIGDPCVLGNECAAGHCASGGYCTEQCSTECGPGFLCMDSECVAAGGVFGDECAEASDCLSELCLDGARPVPICTRACLATCPNGFVCGDVEGRQVCRPESPNEGCSASDGKIDPIALIVLGILVVLRRRRERERRS